MRLLLIWLLALVCLSKAQDEEATTPLTTPAAGETSPQETVTDIEESESVTTEEVVVTTEDAAEVTESLSEETTEEEVDVADGGEVVIEADEEEEEEVEEEEEATVVKSAQYTMSTDAALGLEIEIVLEHLSNDKVRMVCEMEEKEDTSEESDSATETTLAPAAQ